MALTVRRRKRAVRKEARKEANVVQGEATETGGWNVVKKTEWS